MQLGEVRAAKADDFEHFRRLAESEDGWNLQYDKQGTKVYSKVKEGSTVRLIKVSGSDRTFSTVKANLNTVTSGVLIWMSWIIERNGVRLNWKLPHLSVRLARENIVKAHWCSICGCDR